MSDLVFRHIDDLCHLDVAWAHLSTVKIVLARPDSIGIVEFRQPLFKSSIS